MRLGAVILQNYCNYNDFSLSNQFEYNIGSQSRVYLQLVDLNKPLCKDDQGSCYLRYIPADGATLEITINNIDSSKSVTKYPVQDANDPSIWYFDILFTDTIGSGNIHLKLTEGSTVSNGVMIDALKGYPVDPGNISFC